jgi:hypothetical protein
VLFTFPSRYWSTIGHQEVFRLTRWSWQIHTRFLEPRATWENVKESPRFHLQDFHPLRCGIPTHFGYLERFLTPRPDGSPNKTLPQPRPRNTCRLSHVTGLASSPFAHHYSGNHYCFLFLRVLRCFTSPRSHQLPYIFRQRRRAIPPARFPHSEIPGSKSGCRLPGAYRRLPRPSSAPDAKASTVCPKKLGHTTKQRRSRPLCNSQKTNGNPDSHPPKATTQGPKTKKTNTQTRCPFPQNPTACPKTPANPTILLNPPTTKGKQTVLTAETNQKPLNSQRSTNEQPQAGPQQPH